MVNHVGKYTVWPPWIRTPWKINMEHNHGGLEDDIPFQMGDL